MASSLANKKEKCCEVLYYWVLSCNFPVPVSWCPSR
jgi:hypothetical protein